MSKTAEEQIKDLAKKLYHNHLTPETATKLLFDLFVGIGQKENESSKDARIAELEGYGIEPFSATEDDDPKLIDAYDLGAKRMRVKMLDKIKELEKRLEEAENKLEKAAGYVLDSGNRVFFAELREFLTNKTE